VSKYPDNQPISDVTMALINYFGRTGIKEFRIGYSDPEDGEPVVWYATGAWPDNAHEGAGGMTPDLAVERLAELVIDGGLCTNCLKRTVLLLPADDDCPTTYAGSTPATSDSAAASSSAVAHPTPTQKEPPHHEADHLPHRRRAHLARRRRRHSSLS
jgi:hypothetical protein